MTTFNMARQPAGPRPLLASDLEVLRMMSQGLTGGEIAKQLGVTRGTVNFRAQRATETLLKSSRAAAIAEAERLGLIGGAR